MPLPAFVLPALAGAAGGFGLSQLFGGGDQETPEAPAFQLPQWAQGLPPEILNLIRGQVGQQLPVPQEFGMARQTLQDLLALQPQQFQLPIEQIQQALAAQQALQMQQYQQQIRPALAGAGQLDSTYHANLLGQFLQGQQAQTYGTTADLLTQQALQNLQLQQYFPQMRAGVAGQLAGLGGQQAGIGQFNLQLPFQTTIPALQQMYGMGLGQAGQQFQAGLVPYQAQLQQQQQQQAQQQQLMQGLGSLAMSGLSGGLGAIGGLYPESLGISTFGQGALAGLGGLAPGQAQLFGLLGGTQQQPQTYTPQYSSADINRILGQQIQAPSLRYPFQFGRN